MAMIRKIRAKLKMRQYEFSKHAVDQSIIRDISVREVEDAIATRSEVIEDYPDDKYGPSCLILGYTKAGGPAASRSVQLSEQATCQDHHLV